MRFWDILRRIGPKVLPFIRDSGSILLGLSGIAHEEITGHSNWQLLTVYMALIGGPGVNSLRNLRNEAKDDTTEPSSSPRHRRSEPPEPPSPSSKD